MTKEYLINSIKNFINIQIDKTNLTKDISEIISLLSKALGEDLTKDTCNINDDSSPITPEEFTGTFSDMTDYDYLYESYNITSEEISDDLNSVSYSRYTRNDFINITPYLGFDNTDLLNGRQNNYAWSFGEFDGYIYVGTGRNIIYTELKKYMKDASLPLDYTPSNIDIGAEIWRYKKDGYIPWQKVYKSSNNINKNTADIIGISSIVKFKSFDLKTSLYAAAYSTSGVKILKSTNGVDWFNLPSNLTNCTSSGNMIVYKNKLYISVIVEGEDLPSLLYSSEDPEIYGWTLETQNSSEDHNNPNGTIYSMTSFNNHLYLGTSGKDGFMVWRTNEDLPKVNDWKLVIDKGAGDAANSTAISLVEFKDHLYVGTAYIQTDFIKNIIPKGAEIIRLDKKDNWNIIVGGPVLDETQPETGTRNAPLSKLNNGFFNPYNLYMWQMTVYNNKLFVGTYDSSSNVEPIYELLIKNKEYLSTLFGTDIVEILILFVKLQIKVLSTLKDQLGFDFYVSKNGTNYELIDSTGFNHPKNYGIRNIFISDDNYMYIGTANPFSGCSVYKFDYSYCPSRNKH